MKKSIDLKSKIKFSNYILGKVFVVVLSVLIIALIYKDSFQNINFYSILAGLLLLASLGYKSANYISSSAKKLPLIDQLEFALLFTLVFEIIVEISGNNLFPLSYVVLPLIVLAFGWSAGAISFLIISILQISQIQSSSVVYQITTLLLSTLILGYFLRGNKIALGAIFKKNSDNSSGIEQTLTNKLEDESDDSDNLAVLRSDINQALDILSNLVPSHSILFYMKMDDGLYVIADYISDNEDFIDQGQRVSFRGGYLGWVLKTKTPVLITSIKNVRQNLIYYTKDIPVRSLYAAPLLMKSKKNIPDNKKDVVGILIIDSMEKNVFGDKEKLIISLIADRIGEILDRFKLSEQAKLSTQELNSFYEFTQKLNSTDSVDAVMDHIMDTLGNVFEADFAAISEFNEEEGVSLLKRISYREKSHLEGNEIPYTDTLTWLVHEGKNYFNTDNLSARTKYKSIFGKEIDFAIGVKNMKSVLIYPIMEKIPQEQDTDTSILGSIILARNEKLPFDESEIGLAKIICSEAAKFIKTTISHEKVKELSVRDGLTGIYNYRHFQEMLNYTLAHSDRYDEKASLLLIDIDNLKEVNDNYGHQAGDSVLSFVGKVLTESLRKIDVPARYGGDEFALILPNTNKRGSQVVAQKIKDSIKSMPFKFKGDEFNITLSIGISTYPDNAPDGEILIEKADRALYESKNQGRDKVVHYKDISLEELGS